MARVISPVYEVLRSLSVRIKVTVCSVELLHHAVEAPMSSLVMTAVQALEGHQSAIQATHQRLAMSSASCAASSVLVQQATRLVLEWEPNLQMLSSPPRWSIRASVDAAGHRRSRAFGLGE